MVNFTIDQIRWLMDHTDNIRNISVIAHVDHGKSTLSDSLIGHAGIIAKKAAGDTRFMDTRKDEQERTITIKSTSVSLFFEMQLDDLEAEPLKLAQKWLEDQKKGVKKTVVIHGLDTPADAGDAKDEEPIPEGESALGKSEEGAPTTIETKEGTLPFLINLIDCPGHVDFSSEVTASLRVTDGALVVVDCVEGVAVQTETVLRQALAERIRPILFVNKLDRLFLELQTDYEDAYQSFNRAIESVNVIIATYRDEMMGDVQVYPEKGTVGFGSGLMSWGFTVNRFAKMYAARFGVPRDFMMKKLWGDNFFDAKTKRWSTKSVNAAGEKLERGFCAFIIKPIQTLFRAIMEDKPALYNDMITKLGVSLSKEAKDERGKVLLKTVMQTWLPAAEALLQMIVNHLPSPVAAQKYRIESLYQGPVDDECAKAIRACDASGPLMLYVSKMVPTSEKGRFYAFGRIFSGTVATGQTVRILGPDYVPGKKTDLFIKKIQRTVLMMGRYVEQLPTAPCGNVIGLVGIDQYLLKAGTITTHADAHAFHAMKYSVSPVVRVAVSVVNAADLPKLNEGLKRLAKSDPLVQCFTAPTGEHIIAGAGELHLEICLKDLQDDFMKGAPIKLGKPVVSFCESVRAESSMQCIAKSPNKHNRIFARALPLGDELTQAIDSGEFVIDEEAKARGKNLVDNFGWDPTDSRKIWSFGCPPDGKANVIVDMTKAVSYLHEIKDSVVGAFMQATMESVMAGEPMKGIRFNMEDVVLHADSIHRGAGQIMPTVRRAMYATIIKAEPTLLEPVYLCEITVPNHAMSGVYATLNARRGAIETNEPTSPGSPLYRVKAFLPVLESFGFTQLLRQNTSGQAFPQMVFSHYQVIEGDPFEDGSFPNKIIMDVRERKGMKKVMPDFNDYHEKL